MRFTNPSQARDQGIETIYQDLALADNLDISANVFLGRERVFKRFGILPALDRKSMEQDAHDVLGVLDIDIDRNKLKQPAGALSGGQRQAVAIGRVIFWNAELLIMDEPTAALGVPEQRKVIELINRLKERTRRRHHLHLAQPVGHLRGRGPDPGAQTRDCRVRTACNRDRRRRGHQADDRGLGGDG